MKYPFQIEHPFYIGQGLVFLTLAVTSATCIASDSALNGGAYRSAFEQYTPWQPIEERDWVGANATVGKIGGWRYYAREPHLKEKSPESDTETSRSAHNHEQSPEPTKSEGHR